MTCSNCQRETAAVSIGTGKYCGGCGVRAEPAASEASDSAVTKPKSMDLRPTTSNKPAGTAATAMHSRVTPAKGGVLDLRQAKPIKIAPAKPNSHSHTIDHAAARIKQVTTPISHVAPAVVHPVAAKRRIGRFEDRFEQAKTVPKSHHISRFGGSSAELPVSTTRPVDGAAAPAASELPVAAITHHEALTLFVERLEQKSEQTMRAPRTSKYAAITAAVLIMTGYIWLQNYPKFAISAAGSKAGLSASLPGYVPSSFNLSNTSTAPGLVTLSFASPNQSQPLTIEQHRTAWDTGSLLDNYVAKQSTDYTAVQGQGLTIYLFNKDQAAWVNHGVWYSIAGATQLSRDQILKIAYSL